MKNPNFLDRPLSPGDEYKDGHPDSYLETEDGLLDPLAVGHQEAERLIGEREIEKISAAAAAAKADERRANREEDREELNRTFRRF